MSRLISICSDSEALARHRDAGNGGWGLRDRNQDELVGGILGNLRGGSSPRCGADR